jgi:hypothetical protein
MDIDLLILIIGGKLFFIFLCFHLLFLAFLKEEQAIRFTRILFVLSLALCIWVTRASGIEIILLSGFIFSLLALTYSLYLVRLLYNPPIYARIILLFKSKEGKSLEQIQEQFNAKVILDMQLKRLESSNKIIRRNNSYTLASSSKPLFILDSIKKVFIELVDTSNP